jgi:hypothetical protein
MSSHIEDYSEDVNIGAHDDEPDVEAHGGGGGLTQEDTNVNAHDDEPDVEAHGGGGGLTQEVHID